MSKALPKSFYLQETTAVAQQLLGCILVRRVEGVSLSGKIVETEAYIANDPANHGFRGCTKRNATMFGPPGRAYIYRIHNSYCLNAVTQPKGVAEAALIRAVEPLDGLEFMRRARKRTELKDLTTGPGKLCQALALDTELDGVPLTRGELIIVPGIDAVSEIVACPRIGIRLAADRNLRFCVRDSPYISKPVPGGRRGVRRAQDTRHGRSSSTGASRPSG